MTYICIGMDYPFLQPRHLKQEQCSGLLHLYTSLLEGGLILLGAELPEEKEQQWEELPSEDESVELSAEQHALKEVPP
jgi:hypothetical protein